MLFAGPVPATRRETRSARGGYEDLSLAVLQAAAQAPGLRGTATGALEAASGLVSRSLAVASVTGTTALTPEVLSLIGRDLLLAGESVWRLDVDPLTGAPSFVRASWHDVYGGDPRPETWTYRLTLGTPTGTTSGIYGAGQVLHVRYATRPQEPHRGLSPLRMARTLGRLSGALEAALADEAEIPVSMIVPVPEGSNEATVGGVRHQLTQAERRLSLPTTTMAGFGEGRSSAPVRDFDPRRLGPAPTVAEVELHKAAFLEVCAACGVPPSLLDSRAAGASQREGYRQFGASTIQPLARLIATEAGRVLERPITVTHEALSAADAPARAAAVARLVKDAGMTLADARTLVGW